MALALRSPFQLPAKVGTVVSRKSAEIVALPRAMMPRVENYARACAGLISKTFPAPSINAVCDRAERETFGEWSADTFGRILAGETKRIDARMMWVVCAIATMRHIEIPDALISRVTK